MRRTKEVAGSGAQLPARLLPAHLPPDPYQAIAVFPQAVVSIMDRDEALALFDSLTSAPPHVAEHVLDAVRQQRPHPMHRAPATCASLLRSAGTRLNGAGVTSSQFAAQAICTAPLPVNFVCGEVRREEALLFTTRLPPVDHVSSSFLQHGWDVNSAVEWYLESGGVGHGEVGVVPPVGGGNAGAGAGGGDDWGAGDWEDVAAEAGPAPAFGGSAAAAHAAPASPPNHVEEADDVVVEELAEEEPPAAAEAAVGRGRSMRGRAATRPLPAAARPRSSPIEVSGAWEAASENVERIGNRSSRLVVPAHDEHLRGLPLPSCQFCLLTPSSQLAALEQQMDAWHTPLRLLCHFPYVPVHPADTGR